MPTDSIQLQIVKNGGAPATGAITSAFSDSIVLGLGSTAGGIKRVKYRIYEFPDGFVLPAGWTQEAANCYVVTVQNGGDAPAFTLPAGGNELRGKYFFDAVGNDQRSNGSVVGGLRSKAQLKIPFLTTGLEDVGYLETNEFDSSRQAVSALKTAIRKFDVAIFSAGGATDHGALSGLADDDHGQYLRTDGTRALTGNQSAGGFKLTSLGTPTVSTDAATKAYVDSTSGFSPAGTQTEGYTIKSISGVPTWAPTTAYSITAFAAVTTVVRVGATVVNPAFTATHSATPVTLLLTNTDNAESKNVVATPTTPSSSMSYTKTANNSTVTATLTGNDGISAANRSASIAWRPDVYWGTGVAGLTTEAHIEALASSELLASRVKTFSVNATGSLKVYFAIPASYGTPTFTVGGFSGGFTLVSATISVANVNSVIQNYALYESDTPGLGSITVVVS